MSLVTTKKLWVLRWHKDGGFRHWFAWVEAIGLSVGLLTLAGKSTSILPQLVLGSMGLLSVMYVFFWALAWVIEVIAERAPRIALHPLLAWTLATIVVIPTVFTLVGILVVTIYGFLSLGHP